MKAAWIALTVMAACGAWGAWGQSQPPAPAPTKQSRPVEKPAQHKSQSTTIDQRGTEDRSLFVSVTGVPVVEVQSGLKAEQKAAETPDQKDDGTPHKWWLRPDALTAWGTLALFFVGVATAIVFIFQSILLKRQIREMVKATAATEKAANAAELSAKAAIGVELPKLFLTRLNFANDTRTLFDMIQAPYIRIGMKNYGRTPAFVTSNCIAIYRGKDLPEEPLYWQIANVSAGDSVVESDKDYEVRDIRHRDPVSNETVFAIQQGELSFWVYGFVRYKDFLGESHEAKFCRLFMRIFIEGEKTDLGRYMFVDWDKNKKYTESY
jgi:hypothetical protein